MAAAPPCYTLMNVALDGDAPSEQQLKKDFESPKEEVKRMALKTLIQLMINGEKFPTTLMSVIRFVMPCKDHMIKKLLLIYWELVPKTDAQGKLLHEMILVCDAYRKDLLHPNEFVRGATLRFLCKLKQPELLEPVMPSIRECLEHRHPYVRRNAVLAIFTIFKHTETLIPDAPELVHNFLIAEQDPSCKRNAFMMLVHVDQQRALDYLISCVDQLNTFSDIMQLVIVELIYKVCRANPQERGRFIRVVYQLVQSSSAAVRYEAAKTLVSISHAPTAVKASAQAYIDLIIKESDNNVKLIVLDRLIDLLHEPSLERALQEMTMDVMRLLAASDVEVRKKTLDVVMRLVTPRNVDEVVQVLKKEVSKTHGSDSFDKVGEYRQALVRALHTCGVRFPDVAAAVVPLLMDFLGDDEDETAAPSQDHLAVNKSNSSVDVIRFVREVMARFEGMRPTVMEKLLESFQRMRKGDVMRAALWICGEYCEMTATGVADIMAAIRASIGTLPIVDAELKAAAAVNGEDDPTSASSAAPVQSARTLIGPDGTYITQSAMTMRPTASTHHHGGLLSDVKQHPPLRKLLLDGDFFTGAVLATTLTKIATQYRTVAPAAEGNRFAAEALSVIASVMHLGTSGLPKSRIDEDSLYRLRVCASVLTSTSDADGERIATMFCLSCSEAFSAMLTAQEAAKKNSDGESGALAGEKRVVVDVHPDDCIAIQQLMKRDEGGVDEFAESLLRATGESGGRADKADTTTLSRVLQLTGFSDPVYAEAYVNVNQYDILLDVLVVNQTADTLQGLTLEMATRGDLKLSERPQPQTLAPHDFLNIKATVKVSSIEMGAIFGNIVYDIVGSTSDRNIVVLNDIQIDVMDYLEPAHCSITEFRDLWQENEWENLVIVESTGKTLYEQLQSLLQATNMACLTPESMLAGDCEFLAANLFARTIFGEDALANVSLERLADGKIMGHMRIRAKTQGIALSIGNKVTSKRGEK